MGEPTLRDGSAFSMGIPAAAADPAHVCVALPEAARNPVACSGLALDRFPANEIATLAVVRTADGTVTVATKMVAQRDTTEFEATSAPEVTRGYVRGARKEMPQPYGIADASVRSSTTVSREGVRMVHIAYDLSGAEPGSSMAAVAHQNACVVPVENGLYVVMWLSNAHDAAMADALAEATAPGIHVEHPAPSLAFHRGELVGKALGSLVTVLAGIIALIVYAVRRRKAAAMAPAYPPGMYGGYGYGL